MQLSLYSIADHYREAFRDLTEILDSDTELAATDKQQIIEDSLSHLIDDFKTKALNVAGFINNLKLELEAVKSAENRMYKRRNSLESKIQYLTEYLFVQCQKTGTTSIKNDELVIAIKNNPPKVIVDNEAAIPAEFKEVVETVKVAKSAIAAAIKNGLDVIGAHLESSQRLDIR
jgi:hypothetical protein